MIYVPRPIIVPQRHKEEEEKRKIKLFTASEVEDMIAMAIRMVGGSEIMQKNRIVVKPIFTPDDSAVDVYIAQGDLASRQRIEIPRVYGVQNEN